MQSDQIDQLATALSAAQGKMSHATKNLTNPHFKNRYADLAAVIEAARTPLAMYGLAFVQTIMTGDFNVLRTTLMHSSGQFITSEYPLPSGAKPQEFGSALTYGRRYSLSSMLGIASEEDDDGAAASGTGGSSKVVSAALAAVEARKVVQPKDLLDE